MTTSVAVVIPAHDEQALIRSCLASVLASAARLRPPVAVVVVADACSDQTGRRAGAVLRRAGVEHRVLAVRERCVGAARAVGARAAIELAGGPGGLWLACTDADSVVPADWLTTQLELAAKGADAVAGTVRVEVGDDRPPAVQALFPAAYRADDCLERPQAVTCSPRALPAEHRHAHGANLGVRAGAYEAVDGFAAVAVGEDRLLLDRLVLAGHPVAWTLAAPVLTSARRRARAPLGFAAFLDRLEQRRPDTAAQDLPDAS